MSLDDWRPRDLLSSVHEVCRLHWRKRGQPDVQIEELETAGLAYLRISYTHGPWTKHELLGVFDGAPDEPALRRLRSLAGDSEIELVYRGANLPSEVSELARDSKIWLRGFEDYQRALWDPRQYLGTQTTGLVGDPEYPLDLHVDKSWIPLGGNEPDERTALPAIMSWLTRPGPAFVLVLGDFGTGKTFLLRTIANQLAAQDRLPDGLVPVLITMRDLEKGRTLDELLAQHMARCGEDPFHGSAFRYLLREGRIALLFDGFDELALRTSYERVPQHFATLREAAAGAAKVVVTSRHQYFATDQSVRNALGDEVHRLPGSRIIRLQPLESAQRRELVVKTFDDVTAADEFIEALRDVPNLLDLATNPRMLAFMIRWYREGILTKAALTRSAGQQMNAGALYEVLLRSWLTHEFDRQTASGGLRPLSVAQRMEALTDTALRMWRTGRRSLALEDLGEVADQISDLARLEMRPGEALQVVGSSTVLVRTKNDEFAFIHQSVMEWFVAYAAVADLSDRLLADHELTTPMVDFMCDLGGAEPVIGWAMDVATRDETPGPAAKANASLILQRRGAQAAAVNYSGQDLRGRDLTGQDLTNANLSGADLSGAVLSKAMHGADLSNATLVGARLDGADLTNANLSDANLSQARLVGTTLTGANLNGALLERANLLGAKVDPGALRPTYTFGAALPDAQPTPQLAQFSPARCITAILDTDLVVSGHRDGTVRISSVMTAQTLRVLTGHPAGVLSVASLWSGLWLASASVDGTVQIWDTSTGNRIRTLGKRLGELTAMAASSDNNWVATGWKDGTVEVWQTTGEEAVVTLAAHVSRVVALAIDPAGRRLTTADATSIRHWDTASGELLSTVATRGGGPVKQLLPGPTEDEVWVRSLARVSRLNMSKSSWSSPIADNPNVMAVDTMGRWLAVGTDIIRLYRSNSETVQEVLNSYGPREAIALGQAWVAMVDLNGQLSAWDLATGRQLYHVLRTGRAEPSIVVDPVHGHWLSSQTLRRSTVWDVRTGTIVRQLSGRVHAADPATGLVLKTENRFEIELCDPTSAYEYKVYPLRTGQVHQAVLDSAGRWIVLRMNHLKEKTDPVEFAVHTLDTRTAKVVRSTSFTRPTWSVAVDPLGKWLATISGDGVDVWTTETKLFRLGTGFIRRLSNDITALTLAVYPGQPWLLVGSHSGVSVWDTNSWRRLPMTFGAELPPVLAMVTRAENGWMASAHTDGTVRVWRMDGQHAGRTIVEPGGTAVGLALTPDGSWLASAGLDNAVRLWDRETGRLRATMYCTEGGSALWLPDGRYKVYGKPEAMWWAAGLCRFEVEDLDELAPHLTGVHRVAEEEPLELFD